jgi:hypothetical protein
MHRLGPLPPHRRRLGAGGLQPRLLKPALQGPLFRNRLPRELLRQLQLDQAPAPARMRPLEGKSRLLDREREGRRTATVLILQLEAGFSPLAEAGPNLADGAVLELQFLGDGSQGLTALVAMNDLLPLGERQGAGHRFLRGADHDAPDPSTGHQSPSPLAQHSDGPRDISLRRVTALHR